MFHTNSKARVIILGVAMLILMLDSWAQAPEGNRGFKMPANGKRVVVYRLEGTLGHDTLPRTMEDNFYFKIESGVSKSINGVEHGLIFIPPFKKPADVEGMTNEAYQNTPYNRLRGIDGRSRWWVPRTDLERVIPSYQYGRKSIAPLFGAITLPILIRPKRGDVPFSLASDVNLGTCVGARMRLHSTQERHLSLLGIATLKQIKHNGSNNTAMTSDEPETDGSGMALGAGFSVDWDGVQTGFFIGYDSASGNLSKSYVYQNALWMGFGIGVNIVAPNSRVPKVETNKGN